MSKLSIDLKSVIIGLLAGACLALATGVHGRAAPPAAAVAPGRYQVSAVGDGRMYVLDQGENAVYLLRDVGGGGWDVDYAFALSDTLMKFKERERKEQRAR